jgi:hypothetical protein
VVEGVPLDQDGLPSEGLDFGHDGLGLGRALAVVDHNVGPRAGQFEGAPAADPTGRTRHQCLLAEQSHSIPPGCCF